MSDEVWMKKDLKQLTQKKIFWHKKRNETDRKKFRINSKALKQDIIEAMKDYDKEVIKKSKKKPKLVCSYMRRHSDKRTNQGTKKDRWQSHDRK